VQSSLATSGFEYAALTTQAWYTKSVPTAVQTAVAGYVAAEDSAAEKILGTPTTSKNAAGARETGVGLMAMGAVVGVVGSVMAVL
jgi:copper(I)-binding protein